MRHSTGEPTEHVSNRNSHSPDARTSATLAGFDRDDVLVVHLRVTLSQPAVDHALKA